MKEETLNEMLAREEGFRSKPYLCSQGVLTIGHGFTSLTEEESLAVLAIRIDTIEESLSQRIPFWGDLSFVTEEVLIAMAFQLGVQGTLNFERMLGLLQQGDILSASEEMLDSKWYNQTPERCLRMSKLLTSQLED